MAARRLRDYVAGRGVARLARLVRLYDLWVEGKLRLRDPNPPRSWGEALARPDYSLWLYAVVTLSLGGAALTTMGAPLPLRVPAAGLLVFVLPGYSLVRLAFPNASLRPVEELALSMASSVAIAAFTGLVLNYTLGISLEATAYSLALESTALSMAAHYRWWRRGLA